MSIDVFGRKLERTGRGSGRGPPGMGFKLTTDGQYDIEAKRLCNVAEPKQLRDAVNLETLKRLIRSEIQTVLNIIKEMRSEIDDLDTLVEEHRDDLDKALLNLNLKVKNLQYAIHLPDAEEATTTWKTNKS